MCRYFHLCITITFKNIHLPNNTSQSDSQGILSLIILIPFEKYDNIEHDYYHNNDSIKKDEVQKNNKNVLANKDTVLKDDNNIIYPIQSIEVLVLHTSIP